MTAGSVPKWLDLRLYEMLQSIVRLRINFVFDACVEIHHIDEIEIMRAFMLRLAVGVV